jgi:predicted PurR-regulated permease PerM
MQLSTLFQISVLTTLVFYIIVAGQSLLVPLVMAFFFWYLIKILAAVFQKPLLGKHRLNRLAAYALSFLSILGVSFFLVRIIRNNINKVIRAAPTYEANLNDVLNRAFIALKIQDPPNLDQLFSQLDLSALLSQLALTLANIIGNTGLVLAYLFFIFVEQRFFRQKMRALFPQEKQHRDMFELLARIDRDVRTYIGLKTLVSLLTAMLSFIVMWFVGLDFASFWALLIFLLNYIPNIGSLIATLLPSILALVQFPTLQPFAIVAGGVTAIQLTVANILEPRLMGQSLNLSPLVIILSLVLWGALWGIVGMFMCVPLTVIIMIILAQFKQTRPIAVLLSRDGRIRERIEADQPEHTLESPLAKDHAAAAS